MLDASIIRFIFVGVANTAVGLSVIWGTRNLIGASDVIANIAGYAVGITVSFMLNKRWTFAFKGSHGAALCRFLTVFAVSYSANLLLVLALIWVSGQDSFWYQVF